MARTPRIGAGLPPAEKSPQLPNPAQAAKATLAPPRLRPLSTRNYGKGGTPLSGGPGLGVGMGAGIGYGGPSYGV